MNTPMVRRRPNGQLMPGAAVLNPHGRPKGNAIEQLRERYAGRLPEFFEGLIELLKSDEFSALLIDARGLWPIAR
jgi:hypothetical protein